MGLRTEAPFGQAGTIEGLAGDRAVGKKEELLRCTGQASGPTDVGMREAEECKISPAFFAGGIPVTMCGHVFRVLSTREASVSSTGHIGMEHPSG